MDNNEGTNDQVEGVVVDTPLDLTRLNHGVTSCLGEGADDAPVYVTLGDIIIPINEIGVYAGPTGAPIVLLTADPDEQIEGRFHEIDHSNEDETVEKEFEPEIKKPEEAQAIREAIMGVFTTMPYPTPEGNIEEWCEDGSPRVDAIERHLGYDITEDERDDAWGMRPTADPEHAPDN